MVTIALTHALQVGSLPQHLHTFREAAKRERRGDNLTGKQNVSTTVGSRSLVSRVERMQSRSLVSGVVRECSPDCWS